MQNTVVLRITLIVVALMVALFMSATIAPSNADAVTHKVKQCKKLDKSSHQTRCKNRNPDGVRDVKHTQHKHSVSVTRSHNIKPWWFRYYRAHHFNPPVGYYYGIGGYGYGYYLIPIY
jgi:hypothetical protein